MLRLASLALFLLFVPAAIAATDDEVSESVLAEVNGRKISQPDLTSYLAIRGLKTPPSSELRRQVIDVLIERELVRQFLERRKSIPDTEQLAAAIGAAKKRLAAGAENEDAALAKLGTDEKRLEAELAVSLGWRRTVRRLVTEKQIREHFEKNQRRHDGSRLRVSQIFLRYAAGDSQESAPKATARLNRLREQITAGEMSFADAAQANSQAPSASDGGDVGWISPRGDLPAAVSSAAFQLEPGEVSDVILTPFGAHLVTVTELEPGDLSLEDARPAILSELSDLLWNETVAAERENAVVVIHEPAP